MGTSSLDMASYICSVSMRLWRWVIVREMVLEVMVWGLDMEVENLLSVGGMMAKLSTNAKEFD